MRDLGNNSNANIKCPRESTFAFVSVYCQPFDFYCNGDETDNCTCSSFSLPDKYRATFILILVIN